VFNFAALLLAPPRCVRAAGRHIACGDDLLLLLPILIIITIIITHSNKLEINIIYYVRLK
jgi:hypothetical protein